MTSNLPPPVTFTLDADRVGWIVFDTPGAKANVFNEPTLAALEVAVDAAGQSAAVAIVVTGAKDRIWVAGADLRWLQSLPDPRAAEEFSRRGQRLFQRISGMRVPVVAAVHGACAGGGYEMALACHWRIASDAAATQLGLPETTIGTIPGWGGCVRLPRLVGADVALDHILRGQLVDGRVALTSGLVDECVPAIEIRERARAVALRLANTGVPTRPPKPAPPASYFSDLRNATALRTHGRSPASLAAIDAVAGSIDLEVDAALEVEARRFGEVTAAETCRNLIHVFFLKEAAKKRTLDGWFAVAAGAATPSVQRVGVIGAGVMGSGIAHWLASRGFDVVLRDVRLEFIERALGVIRKLLDDGVARGKTTAEEAGVVFGRIRTTVGWDGFSDCDLVVEAIVENVAAKQALFSELAAVVRPDALLASNTSALPIDEIAGHVRHPERTLGIHFFNPVSRMALVELVLGQRTSADVATRALDLVRRLGKSPVICRSSPGFLVTRVLFFYLNAAVGLWERGVETPVIDAAMREFGWPMGPLRLIDEVGVDVTAFIFGEMEHYYPDQFVRTTACDRLVAAGLNGRKNGASRGFYRYPGREEIVNEEETRRLATVAPTGTATPAPDRRVPIGLELLDVMVGEARRCLAEGVVRTPDDVDFALLTGAGFPPSRGGLLRWADRLSSIG